MQDQFGDLAHILYFKDLILSPIYFLLIVFGLVWWKNKYYKNSPLRKYILPAFLAKTLCCIILVCIYEYYYQYGDSHNYFSGVYEIWLTARENPKWALELIFKPFSQCSVESLTYCNHLIRYDYSISVLAMFKIAGFVGLFCFGSYFPIALIFTLLGFIGTWKIFCVFYDAFPKLIKPLAISILFAPSCLLWSSALIKEPLCMFGLGLCFSVLYSLLKGRFNGSRLFEFLVGALLLVVLKAYILAIFLVAAVAAIYQNQISKIQKKQIRIMIRVLVNLGILGSVLWLVFHVSGSFQDTPPSLLKDIEVIQNIQQDMGGSTYVIPDATDYSAMGIIRTYLLSFNVTLFRPYLWESPNIIGLASALESFLILCASFFLLIRHKFWGFFSFSKLHPILLFSLVFTLLMAPLAGLVSFNFGTLARYKLPLVPFYYTYLILQFYPASKFSYMANESKNSHPK